MRDVALCGTTVFRLRPCFIPFNQARQVIIDDHFDAIELSHANPPHYAAAQPYVFPRHAAPSVVLA